MRQKRELWVVKRILCLLLCACCIFFTGCNSIIYNGDINFKAYEPETLPDVSGFVSGGIRQAEAENMEKYNIEGTDAFLILPDHCNNPESILDFVVLDYNSDNRFVYAYMTPYLGAGAPESGLTAAAKGNGKAFLASQKEEREENGEQDSSNAKNMVTVLMSYQPDTGDYTVFFSRLSPLTDAEVSLMTHKLGNQEEYFLFYDQAAWLYDKAGTQIYYYDVSTVLMQELETISAKEAGGKALDMVISDVVMDQSYYLYIPLICQTVETEEEEIDEDTEAEEIEETIFQKLLVCYQLDIGGKDADIVFYSDNLNWESQKKLWLEKNGNKSSPFASKEDLDAYCKNASLTNIKTGKYGKYADNFDVFYTKGSPINLELAGIADLNDFTIGVTNGTKTSTIKADADTILTACESYFKSKNITALDFVNWESIKSLGTFISKYSERRHWMVMTGLALGAQSYSRFLNFNILKNYHFVIPGIRPGAYDSKKNTNPWNLTNMGEEGLFAYKTSGTAENKTSKYAVIQTAGRFSLGGAKLRPSMAVVGNADKITRTLYYNVTVEKEEEQDGKKVKVKTTETKSVTETASAYNHYRVYMPEGTTVSWLETFDRSDMVAIGNSWGAIYYTDNSSGDEDSDSFSKIEYNDGLNTLLKDSGVPGKAKDARVLYNGNEQLLVFVTSDGAKFYLWQNGKFQTSQARFLSFYTVDEENAAQSEEGESYDAEAFTLAGSGELLISSLEKGLIHYNINNQMSFSLLAGAYYSSFRKGSGDNYVVLGYQTEEYSYLPRDISRAKKYEINLAGRDTEFYVNAVENYLEETIASVKANRYLADKTSSQKKADVLVEQMFYSTEQKAEATLDALLAAMKISRGREELLAYVKKRRVELLEQREAISRFYALAGIRRVADSKDEELLRALETSLTEAYYTSEIEMRLVEVKLLETSVNQISDADMRARYRQYQSDYAAYLRNQQAGNQGLSSEALADTSALGSEAVRELMLADFESSGSGDSSKTEVFRSGLEKMSFYQEILGELKAACAEDWDVTLKTLLSKLTEGKATDRKAEALNALCALMGRTEETLDLALLEEDLSECRTILSLEELIVSYNLDAAEYQRFGFAAEYEAYLEQAYADETEKRRAFESASFYRIVSDAKARTTEDWEETLSSIIKNGGSGFVWNQD